MPVTEPTYGVPVAPPAPAEPVAPVSADVPADEPVAEAPIEVAPEAPVEPEAAAEPVGEPPVEPPVEPPTEPAPPTVPEPITPSPAEPEPAPPPPAGPVTPEPAPDPPTPAPPAFEPPAPVEPAATETLDAALSAAAAATTEVAPDQIVPESYDQPVAEEPPRRSGALLGAAAAGVPLLLLSGFLFTQRGSDAAERLAARRVDALAESRQLALNLVSIDYRTLDRDLQRISDSTTGKAREEFDEKILENDSYKALVKDNEAVITSTIQRIGLEQCGSDDAECKRGDKAVVLVFLDQESKNKLRTTPRVDRNRVALTLVRRDGSWLVSEVKVL